MVVSLQFLWVRFLMERWGTIKSSVPLSCHIWVSVACGLYVISNSTQPLETNYRLARMLTPKGSDCLLGEIQKNGAMTGITLCNDICQCSPLKAASLILTKYEGDGTGPGNELKRVGSDLLFLKKKMIVKICLKCLWHGECMRSTDKCSLLSKGCRSFPQFLV